MVVDRSVGSPCQRDVNARSTHGLQLAPTRPHGPDGASGREQDEFGPVPTSADVDRLAHNPKVAGSNPAPATNSTRSEALSVRRDGPRPLPGVNALSTRDGVGARVHSSVVVGARAIESVLVSGVLAGTVADENRREHPGAAFCLDHLGENPMVFVGAR